MAARAGAAPYESSATRALQPLGAAKKAPCRGQRSGRLPRAAARRLGARRRARRPQLPRAA
eukprot:4936658-Alexandrium_andersonii.AAC.1